MDSRFFREVTPETKEQVKQKLLTADEEFMYVRGILEKQIESRRSRLESSEILSNANWHNEVATILGEIRAFKHVVALLTLAKE
jgi:hypothetical protein